MRKVILFMHMSLDGYVAGPNGELDWGTMTDHELHKYFVTDLLADVDTVLIGRGLYHGFMSYWPAVAANPASPKDLAEFAHWLEDAPKIVFSETLESADWNNSTLVKNHIAEEVARLKQQPGKDMVIFGGAGIVATFSKLGLIDEYRIKLEPIVLGKGKALFKDIPARIKLKLTNSKTFESGVVGLYYQRQEPNQA